MKAESRNINWIVDKNNQANCVWTATIVVSGRIRLSAIL
jgi:hypothetical protein